MSLFGAPQPGDWVTLRRTVKVGLFDYLIGGEAGVKRGTRGVVVRRSGWGRLEIRLDTGLTGATTARVRSADVRVVRRGGGSEAFARRTERLNAARAGVALALVAPPAYFSLSWFLHGGSRGGLLAALVSGLLQGVLDLLAFGLGHPVSALLYLLVLGAATRFAFGR